MIFKEKRNGVKSVRYTEDRKTLGRRINFKRALAEEINVLIAVFNNENEAVKLNNTIVVNVALNCFLKQLENIPEEEALAYLEKKALEEARK